MKRLKIKLNYLSVIKYVVIFFAFLVFNNIEKDVLPYSTSLFIALLYSNASLIITPLIFILSILIFGKTGLLLSSGVIALFFTVAFLIYRKCNTKPNLELYALTVISLTPFLVLGDTSNFILPLEKRIITSLLILVLTFLCVTFINSFSKKGLKYKYAPHEKVIAVTLLIISGVGISNFTSPLVFKCIAFFFILAVSFIYKSGYSVYISTCLGLCFSVYYSNIIFLSVYLALAIITALLTPISRHLASVGIIVCDLLVNAVFSVYPTFGALELISGIIGSVCFSFVPNKALLELKEKLYAFREKQLSRQSINRNRTLISNRLYQLANVFSEMSFAFETFEKNTVNEQTALDAIQKNIEGKVCFNCQNKERCFRISKIKLDISKLIEVGLAKGKVSVIDLPKSLGEECVRPNDIIFPLNKLLAEYRSTVIEKQNVASGRRLLAEETEGVSQILRSLALESGTLLKYQSRLERNLSNELMKNGILVSELLIYGDTNSLSVGVIVTMKEIAIELLLSVISKTLNTDMTLIEKVDITEDKIYFYFKKSPTFDAVFGVSAINKNGSNLSGDTHSVTRIKEDKFLVALADGMGSGDTARKISNSSLTLIESFYKAGLSGDLVLNTVNKLLAINTDDSFTALDACVIDLKNGGADFIKYGTPYGFIIGNDGIRIIEGNTLPLGILNELRPAVCSASLNNGDIVLFMSDGISDAFGSSGEIIEFLKTVPAKNPQSLTDELLKKAIEFSGGIANDDMTALAVRIFKKQSLVA